MPAYRESVGRSRSPSLPFAVCFWVNPDNGCTPSADLATLIVLAVQQCLLKSVERRERERLKAACDLCFNCLGILRQQCLAFCALTAWELQAKIVEFMHTHAFQGFLWLHLLDKLINYIYIFLPPYNRYRLSICNDRFEITIKFQLIASNFITNLAIVNDIMLCYAR